MMKKRIYTSFMVAVLAIATLTAASFTIGLETESNGFSFNARQEEGKPSVTDLDLGVDLSMGIYSKSGVGMYLSGGYNLTTKTRETEWLPGVSFSEKLAHGMTAGLGFSVKKEISKSTDFMLSTGFGLLYNFTEKYLELAYDVGIDFLFNIGQHGYVKLGAGYELGFLEAWKPKGSEELATKTFLDHRVLVPTIGFGIKF